MMRKPLVVGGLVLGLLVIAALIVTTNHYSGPEGAATGTDAGCGGGPLDEEPLDSYEADVPTEEVPVPYQIVYREFVNDQECLRVIVEPVDGIVTFDPRCTDDSPEVMELSPEQTKQLLDGYRMHYQDPCIEGECPPESRVEILTDSEETFYLPLVSPLRETIDEIRAGYQTAAATTEGEESPHQGSLQLRWDEGAVFMNGEVRSNASPLNVDLICYKASKTVDLKPGAGPTMANEKPMQMLRTPGGTYQSFSSVDGIPSDNPKDGSREMLHNAKPGMGCVLQNNVSPGFTKILVKEATSDSVTIEYETF